MVESFRSSVSSSDGLGNESEIAACSPLQKAELAVLT